MMMMLSGSDCGHSSLRASLPPFLLLASPRPLIDPFSPAMHNAWCSHSSFFSSTHSWQKLHARQTKNNKTSWYHLDQRYLVERVCSHPGAPVCCSPSSSRALVSLCPLSFFLSLLLSGNGGIVGQQRERPEQEMNPSGRRKLE